MDKLFTPQEVDACIPEMEALLTHLEGCQARAQELAAYRPSDHPGAAEVAEAARIRSQIEFLMSQVHEDIDRIADMGGVVKDLAAGLVDFLGQVNARAVWLCWKRGEKQVHFWHPLDAGFTARQSLGRSSERTRITP